MRGLYKMIVRTHLPLVSFVVFVVICSGLMVFYQSRALNELKERSNQILAHYSRVLSASSDQMMFDEIDWRKYINEFKLTPGQSFALQDFSKEIIEKAVMLSHVDVELNSIIESKAPAMYQETKDLLEMQFAKIQHESESLEIWVGLLTVVFLIFSFYSLFKTDELVKQGRDGLKELSSLKRKGEDKLSVLEQEGNKKIQEIDSKGQKKIESFESSSLEALSKMKLSKQDIQESLNAATSSATRDVSSLVEEANKSLDAKYSDLAEALDAKLRESSFSSSGSVKDELFAQIKLQLDSLNLRILRLENNNG